MLNRLSDAEFNLTKLHFISIVTATLLLLLISQPTLRAETLPISQFLFHHLCISNGIRYFYALLPSERRPSVLLLAVAVAVAGVVAVVDDDNDDDDDDGDSNSGHSDSDDGDAAFKYFHINSFASY
uniref:Bm9733 n=1 Tax=Brugia malayi TaxID=6279 RepID=A0A0J9XT45_BRUMA|nr:Bm9733 [Brugia malayi]